jgi:1-acyl-sn-glycerol-3-phosphate acyltransferase
MRSLAVFLNRCYLNMKVEVVGLENVPKDERLVVYANHKSYTDAFTFMQIYPKAVTLTPKKSVLKIPFLRAWLKAYDVFPINRDNPRETLKDLDNAVKVVRNKQTILLFPEGTIKNRMEEFVEDVKAGSFRLVKNAEAGILPVRFDGNDLVRKRWPKRSHRKITIFPLIPYSVIKDLSTVEIAKLFMNTINIKN